MYPFIHIFGRTIGTYGLCMMLGVFLAAFLAIRLGKKRGVLMEDILIVGATAMGCALVCGSLLYVFVTYPLSEIWAMIKSGEFKFLTSGIVFYGGLIGGILGALLGCRIAGCKLSSLESVVVPFIPLGHAIGRIGCIMAGCCHGMEYTGPLAIYYPHSVTGLSPEQGYFPVQGLEALLNVFVCLLLVWYERRKRRPMDMLFVYLGCYAVERFILELFRGDSIRGIYFGLSTSQWISVGLLAACAVHFLFLRRRAAKKV